MYPSKIVEALKDNLTLQREVLRVAETVTAYNGSEVDAARGAEKGIGSGGWDAQDMSNTGGVGLHPEELLQEVRAIQREFVQVMGEIEGFDTWPRAVWRHTGGRIAWGATLVLNAMIAIFTSIF